MGFWDGAVNEARVWAGTLSNLQLGIFAGASGTTYGFESDGVTLKAVKKVGLSPTVLTQVRVADAESNLEAANRQLVALQERIANWPGAGTRIIPPGSTEIVPLSGRSPPAAITNISGLNSLTFKTGVFLTPATVPMYASYAEFDIDDAPGGDVLIDFWGLIDFNFNGIFKNGRGDQGRAAVSLSANYAVAAIPSGTLKLDLFQKDPNTGALDASVTTGAIAIVTPFTVLGIAALARGASGVYLPELNYPYCLRATTAGGAGGGSIILQIGVMFDGR